MIEIILVDDGSPDDSGAICDEYASSNPRVSVIHKENGGLSSARYAGWRAATGRYIVFVDSDDYVAPDYISALVKPFGDPTVQLSICGYANDNAGVIKKASLPYNDERIPYSSIGHDYILPLIGTIYKQGYINIPGFVWIRMYIRTMLRAEDFVSEREYFTEDIIMNILYARRIIGSIAVVNRPLYFYCINPGSLTLKYREGIFSMLMARYEYCRKLAEDLDAEPEELKSRLTGNLISGVMRSIFNIGRIRNYKLFQSELKSIFEHREVKALFEDNRWTTSGTWSKIILFTHNHNLSFILYKLLKLRKTL